MWELYKVDAGWLLVGGRRYRRNGKSVRRDVDPDLIHRLSLLGKDLAEAAIAGARAGHLSAALRLRTAAHMCLAAELSSRLSEIALMLVGEIIDERGQMIALLDGEHSKTGADGRDPITPETAEIIRQYLLHARPVLLGPGVDGNGRGLWITQEGLDAEAGGMAAALRRATGALAPGGVSPNDIRSSALSQAGQTLPEKAQQARHVFGSMTAATVYAKRDRGAVLQKSIEQSTIKSGDLPPAMLPEPRGKVRRAAARAAKRKVAKRKTTEPNSP
jgi:integrase